MMDYRIVIETVERITGMEWCGVSPLGWAVASVANKVRVAVDSYKVPEGSTMDIEIAFGRYQKWWKQRKCRKLNAAERRRVQAALSGSGVVT
jgi:hypothetical protein